MSDHDEQHDEQHDEYPKIWAEAGMLAIQYGPHAMTITTNTITINSGGSHGTMVHRSTEPPPEAER